MGTMKHRPFSELTEDWPPKRVARSEAKVKKMLAELERRDRQRPQDERPTPATTESAPGRSPEPTR